MQHLYSLELIKNEILAIQSESTHWVKVLYMLNFKYLYIEKHYRCINFIDKIYTYIYIARKNDSVTEVKRFSRSFQFYGKLVVFGHCLVKCSSIINTRILSVPIRLQNSSSFFGNALSGRTWRTSHRTAECNIAIPDNSKFCKSIFLFVFLWTSMQSLDQFITSLLLGNILSNRATPESRSTPDQSQDASLNLQFEWRLPPMR